MSVSANASSKLTDAERAQLTAYFVGLDQSADGKKRLASLTVQGFTPYEQAKLMELGKWLGL